MNRGIVNSLKSSALFLVSSLFGCSEPQIAYDQLDDIGKSIHNPARLNQDRKLDQRRMPAKTLALLDISPGMTVVDVLGGSGYYSELFAHLVGEEGKVVLQNNSLFLRFSAEDLVKRLHGNRLPNVTRLDSEFANMQLPEADVIFLGLSYHDAYVPRDEPVIQADPTEFKNQLWQALRPGGQMLITDHAAAKGSGKTTTGKLHRIEKDFVINDLTDRGFILVKESHHLQNPDDDYSKSIWAEGIMGRTDRFVLLFEKPL